MDPLSLPLALGCVLVFSQIDTAITDSNGRVPDAVFYKTLTLQDAQGRHHVLERLRPGQAVSPGADQGAGPSPDGLYASYVVLMQTATHDVNDLRFVSAESCAAVRFVNSRTGATVNAAAFRGWLPDAPHGVRIRRGAKDTDVGLPIHEARERNPAIQD